MRYKYIGVLLCAMLPCKGMESQSLTRPSREALIFYTALIDEYANDKTYTTDIKKIFGQAQNTDALINLYNSNGNTLLHVAAAKGDDDFILWLLAKQANPFIENKNNQTARDIVNAALSKDKNNTNYSRCLSILIGVEKQAATNSDGCCCVCWPF